MCFFYIFIRKVIDIIRDTKQFSFFNTKLNRVFCAKIINGCKILKMINFESGYMLRDKRK